VANHQMKNWEVIADRLSKAGWSWGCVSITTPFTAASDVPGASGVAAASGSGSRSDSGSGAH